MVVNFDKFNRAEQPVLYLCNPGCSLNTNGTLSSCIGVVNDASDMELVANFNEVSTLNFRVIKNTDDSNAVAIFDKIKHRRMIYTDEFGFFVIGDVDTIYENGTCYKDIEANSVEIEMQDKMVPYIMDGTYVFITATNYVLLSAQPSDWETNYAMYYYFDTTSQKYKEVESTDTGDAPTFETNTYYYTGLLNRIINNMPGWTIDQLHVSQSLYSMYRTFEDVAYDSNVLSFLLEDMQEAYECVFTFNTKSRTVSAYIQSEYLNYTSIHITRDDLINNIKVTEDSDDLYTAIEVYGEDDIGIQPVNPLGSNVIYNFDYYLSWMSTDLQVAVESWVDLVEWHSTDNKIPSQPEDWATSWTKYFELNASGKFVRLSGTTPPTFVANTYYFPNYKMLNRELYDLLESYNSHLQESAKYETLYGYYDQCYNNIVQEGNSNQVSSWNKYIVEQGGSAIIILEDISALLLAIDGKRSAAKTSMATEESAANEVYSKIAYDRTLIDTIISSLSFENKFTEEQYEELSVYMFEGSYTNSYISITDDMTYDEKFEQYLELYNNAREQLQKISEPTQEFSIDVENFVFQKEFSHFTSQLETGCLVNVEVEDGDIAEIFLTGIQINWEDYTLSMTFGNRFNKFDTKSIFNNVLGSVKRTSNSIEYVKEVVDPVKAGAITKLEETVDDTRSLAKDTALNADNNEVLINDTGILLRRRVCEYNVLSEKPSDWDTLWNNYYTRYVSPSTQEVTYTHIQSSTSAPEFEINTYYESVPKCYALLTSQPSDWATMWKNYYIKEGSTYKNIQTSTAPTFVTNTYYEIISQASAYEASQLKITNNEIVITKDGWSSASIAIGKFTDDNGTEQYGINADTIVAGTISTQHISLIDGIFYDKIDGVISTADQRRMITLDTEGTYQDTPRGVMTLRTSSTLYQDAMSLIEDGETEPTDWGTNWINYRTKYIPVVAEPESWSSIYTQYYVIENNEFVLVEQAEEPPEFEVCKYYRRSGTSPAGGTAYTNDLYRDGTYVRLGNIYDTRPTVTTWTYGLYFRPKSYSDLVLSDYEGSSDGVKIYCKKNTSGEMCIYNKMHNGSIFMRGDGYDDYISNAGELYLYNQFGNAAGRISKNKTVYLGATGRQYHNSDGDVRVSSNGCISIYTCEVNEGSFSSDYNCFIGKDPTEIIHIGDCTEGDERFGGAIYLKNASGATRAYLKTFDSSGVSANACGHLGLSDSSGNTVDVTYGYSATSSIGTQTLSTSDTVEFSDTAKCNAYIMVFGYDSKKYGFMTVPREQIGNDIGFQVGSSTYYITTSFSEDEETLEVLASSLPGTTTLTVYAMAWPI